MLVGDSRAVVSDQELHLLSGFGSDHDFNLARAGLGRIVDQIQKDVVDRRRGPEDFDVRVAVDRELGSPVDGVGDQRHRRVDAFAEVERFRSIVLVRACVATKRGRESDDPVGGFANRVMRDREFFWRRLR